MTSPKAHSNLNYFLLDVLYFHSIFSHLFSQLQSIIGDFNKKQEEFVKEKHKRKGKYQSLVERLIATEGTAGHG